MFYVVNFINVVKCITFVLCSLFCGNEVYHFGRVSGFCVECSTVYHLGSVNTVYFVSSVSLMWRQNTVFIVNNVSLW